MSIQSLVDRIIKTLALPKFDKGGNPSKYLLGRIINEDEEPEIFEFEDDYGREQTLMDYNVMSGDHLVVVTVPIAGGCIYDPVMNSIPQSVECSSIEECDRMPNYAPADSDYRRCAPESAPYNRERDLSSVSADDEEPSYLTTAKPKKGSIWKKLFGKRQKTVDVNASAYAPAKIVAGEDFIIRVFIHMPDETDNINSLIKEIDPASVKKANKPLGISVNEGDKITVNLVMPEDISVDCSIQSAYWRGKSLEFDFGCLLSEEFASSRLCRAIVAVNDIPAGELKFILKVVYETPAVRTASVDSHKFSKIFISYSHADYEIVRGIAEGCRINASDYFFDRHSLKGGDVFKDKILDYINRADLFVLCWSENAAKSEWVQLEIKHAVERIEKGSQTLSVYPICLPPPAQLPPMLSDKYNFVNLL